MSDTTIKEHLARYLQFAASKRRERKQIEAEFWQLIEHPNLVSYGFLPDRDDIMLLQTPDLILTDYDGCSYQVSSIICVLQRQVINRYGTNVNYGFAADNPLPCPEIKEHFHVHPHISLHHDKNEQMGIPSDVAKIGGLCISEGERPFMYNLRKGMIVTAYEELLTILTTYPAGRPFLPLEKWPKVKESSYGS